MTNFFQRLADEVIDFFELVVEWTGDATINQLQGFSVSALAFTGQYDVTVPSGDAVRATARLTGHGEFLTLAGQAVQTASGIEVMPVPLNPTDPSERLIGAFAYAGGIEIKATNPATILELSVNLGKAPWRLTNGTTPPVV